MDLFITRRMISTVNSSLLESAMNIDQSQISNQVISDVTVSLPPKGYCPANAPPRNFIIDQRNTSAIALAMSASSIRPDQLAKSMIDDVAKATSGTAFLNSEGHLDFRGPYKSNPVLIVSDRTRMNVTNAVKAKLGSYMTSTQVNNQTQTRMNVLMMCGNVSLNQTNYAKAMATDIALAAAEILMAAPEVQTMKDKLAPQLPNPRLVDMISDYFATLSTQAAVVWLLVLVVLIYLLFFQSEE